MCPMLQNCYTLGRATGLTTYQLLGDVVQTNAGRHLWIFGVPSVPWPTLRGVRSL